MTEQGTTRKLEGFDDVYRFLVELIDRVETGNMDPVEANTLGYLSSILLDCLGNKNGTISDPGKRTDEEEIRIRMLEGLCGPVQEAPEREETENRPISTGLQEQYQLERKAAEGLGAATGVL